MTELWAHHDSKAQEEKYALEACKYQSSCNLVKQAQARKAKKSLNIIHIGNICAYLTLPRCAALAPRIRTCARLTLCAGSWQIKFVHIFNLLCGVHNI